MQSASQLMELAEVVDAMADTGANESSTLGSTGSGAGLP